MSKIDLNCLLPDGTRFTPLFEDDDYQKFRDRYEAAMLPELKEQAAKRRRSEQDTGSRIFG